MGPPFKPGRGDSMWWMGTKEAGVLVFLFYSILDGEGWIIFFLLISAKMHMPFNRICNSA